MPTPTPFVQDVAARLAALGPVAVRAMFGGWGLTVDGRFCAIVHHDTLYLKTDAATRPVFEARQCRPFRPFPGRPPILSYHEAPAEVFEDPAELHRLGRLALEAALRSGTPAGTRRTRKRPAARKGR